MFPRDPNAPTNVLSRMLFGMPKRYFIKGDPLGRTCFPKPSPVILLRPWTGKSNFREE